MAKKKKSSKKKSAKRGVTRSVIIIAAVAVIGFSVTAVLWGKRYARAPVIEILPEHEIENTDPEQNPAKEENTVYENEPAVKAIEEKKTPSIEQAAGNVVIIIDDVGYNLHQLEPFLQFPGPIVFAILPGVPYSEKAAKLIHEANKTCIIHQPMQAKSVQNLGQNPILMDMDTDEITAVIEKSIAEVPGAIGMNNHMGSLITSNPEKMDIILQILQDKDMVFIDSLTTADSAVKKSAQKLGMPYLHRHIFLDNEKTEEYYAAALAAGFQKAKDEGVAVLIGHVWADGLAEVLTDKYEEAVNDDVSFISLDVLQERVIRYAGIGN